jgi:hypothetical protein
MPTLPYAVWLIPADEHRELLGRIILELSSQFAAPLFPPHATLCSGTFTGSLSDIVDSVDRLSQGLQPVSLTVTGIDYTEAYFGFLFARLRDDGLFAQALQVIPNSNPPPVGPHLSLLYGDKPSAARRAELNHDLEARLPTTLLFSAVQIIVPTTGNWRDIDNWQVKHARPFSV